ncbi:cellular tumor antigen p53 [Trichonephila inaurata madagascariensis]|uniref:Cellular tumor antigen p53 n=2 Tax=Trichonephila inaurata madagascariensis TaxID=2747483 RepID=A0A8X6YM71_9ARAC|nr:cellular tumor antigen p53 [Trichonephila inaurata madagascariensis]
MNDKSLSSSQESLPLSQEALNTLLQMINSSGKVELDLDNFEDPDWNSLVDVTVPAATLPPVYNADSSFPFARSSLPVTSNWPGEHSFKVSFENQEKNNKSKHINWTYSETSNKLYVRKDASCPVNFSTKSPMEHDCTVRAMAVYSAPEHIAQPVTRCFNHSRSESDKGVREAEHLIRSESSFALYQIDSKSRHSVIVPFDNPQAGEEFSTYIFKFSCFSSCAGGPNRRLLTLIFTLEQGNILLGRQSLELKICANPRRDREMAEKGLQPEPSTSNLIPTKKFKPPEEIPTVNPGPSIKRAKIESKKKKLRIEAEDEECYLFLRKMKDLYKLYRGVNDLNNIPSNLSAMIYLFRSSSSEDDDRP